VSQLAIWTGNQLPPVNLAMLALAAPYTAHSSAPADQLASHDHSRHTDAQCSTVQGMRDWWGVNDRNETLETLDQLLAGMHAPLYDRMAEMPVIAERWAPVVHGPDARLLPFPAPRSIVAWDIARLANMVRNSFSIGRLSEGESWAYLEAALLRARGAHLDWLEYGHAFLLGRAFWLAYNTDYGQIAASFAENGPVIRQLNSDPVSPWLHTRL